MDMTSVLEESKSIVWLGAMGVDDYLKVRSAVQMILEDRGECVMVDLVKLKRELEKRNDSI
ncbi:unnamed protein product [marine sediment metagenome]|uniref:Uncharacterized protein n=1 Tax=marine sediment metagenome TaxID=412755 RepID=X0RRX7_9ZZZZ